MGGTTNIQQPPSKTQLLYDAVSKDYNVGTYDEFQNKLQDPTKRKAFYEGVGKEFNLGSYKEFEQKITGDTIKKKEDAGSPSPSDSSPKPVQTAQPVDTSGSEQKPVAQNFKNNTVTAQDVGKVDTGGLTPDMVQRLINNKGRNIDKIQNAPSNYSSQYLSGQLNDVNNQLSKMESMSISASEYRPEDVEAHKQKISQLQDRQKYIQSEIQKNYDYSKKSIIPELTNELKGMVDDSEFDSKTHLLKPVSVQWVARHVDDFLNKKGDGTIDLATSGNLDRKSRTYPDITKGVVDQLNLIPIQKAQQKFAQDFAKDHPEISDALKANEEINSYFSHSNFDEVKSKIKIQADKEAIQAKEKYWGNDGIFMKNSVFKNIQEKYGKLVGEGKMTDEVARKQIQAEVKTNPELKKIQENYDTEIRKIVEGTQKQYEQYVVGGLRKEHPKYTIYGDGTPGLSSLSEGDYKKLLTEYSDGMNGVAKKMGAETNEAWNKIANDKGKSDGPFIGSLKMSTNAMMEGLTKMIFNKTGWGGDRVQHFEAQDIATPDVSQSEAARTWNWKGWESLLNPNFYLSGAGNMVPVIAGGAVVTAATEGTGVPEYVGWLANAGLFTAQSSLSTYNQLLSTKDQNGRMLSESEAAHYTADQAKADFLPNFLMMMLGSGTLSKAKNIVKPALGRAAVKGLLGAAEAQPFFTWQGYNSYATMQEAQGKNPDFYDYMQSPEFRDNLVNGLIMGGAMSLLHLPFNYKKSMDNWTKLVHTSEGEFKNQLSENYALGQEMAGNGNYLRDALKLHVFNTDPETLNEEGRRQLADLKNSLLYSTNLDRNMKAGNLDRTKIQDLYQGHNLALADQQDFLSQQSKDSGNNTLSDLYKDKAKEYREKAKESANGEAKGYYLMNAEGSPIFLSDKSFKTLEADGKIASWMKDGTIKGAHSLDDPEFASRYSDFVSSKGESEIEGKDLAEHAADLVEANKNKLGAYYFVAKSNPDAFFKEVSDQVHGINADGSPSLRPDAEQAAREQYGDDIVDLSKVLYPAIENQENATTKSQGIQREVDQQTSGQEHTRTSPPREEETQPQPNSGNLGTDGSGQEIAAEDNITVSEMLDKKGIYKGQRGTFTQDGQTVIFKPENSNREYELGNINEVGDRSLKDFGIDTEKSVVEVGPEGKISVRGNEYVNPNEDPLKSIVRDKDGNVTGVKMETSNGERRTFRGQVAEDLAYELTLKSISNEQPAFEQFINEDAESRKEMEDAGLPETTEGAATKNNEPVQREKIDPVENISSPKIDNDEKTKPNASRGEGQQGGQESKREGKGRSDGGAGKEVPGPLLTEEGGSGKTKSDELKPAGPPVPPPEPRIPKESPKDEYTSVRKEKLKEIKGVKEMLGERKKTKWSETYQNALENVMGMFPNKSLYESMRSRVGELVAKLDAKEIFANTSEDIAVFNVLRNETEKRMAEIPGWDSQNNLERMAAVAQWSTLNNDLYNIARVTNPEGESGRAFGMLQSEANIDPEEGLKLRRMELLASKGGERLTPEELEDSAKLWDRERDLMQKESDLRQKGMQEAFDREMEEVKAEHEKQLKEAREGRKATKAEQREKTLKEKGKDFADRLRGGKLKGDQLYAVPFPGLKQTVNFVIEAIAQAVEKGATLAEAIDGFIKEHGVKSKEQFTKDLFTVLDKQDMRAESFEKIRDFAENNGVTDVTNEMAGQNLIRDFINSHVGLHDPEQILDIATNALKGVLPDVEKERLLEAYLKQGDFKQLTKKQSEDGFKQSQRNLDKLAKLEKDINDLNNKRELFKKRSSKKFPDDALIEKKQKELNTLMDVMGIKVASDDKYKKASYDERAKSYNDRLDGIGQSIEEKLDKGTLSPESESALRKLKAQLDASTVVLDPTSALSQERTLEGGLSLLKSIQSEFNRGTKDDISKTGDIRRALQKAVDGFNTDKDESEQNVKLQRAKDKAKRDAKMYFDKIARGEYEDEPPVILSKTDPELLKLQRERNAIAQIYKNRKNEYLKDNKTRIKRAWEFLRGAEVAALIGSPVTFLKVFGSAVIRPTVESISKLIVGKAFEALPFDFTKTVSDRAKAGGEGSDVKQIQKGWKAYLGQYSEEKIGKMYQDASDKYTKALSEFQDHEKEINRIKYAEGKNSDAYRDAEKKYDKLKNAKNDALVNAVGYKMYDFMSGKSLADGWEVFLHRSNELERSMGDFSREGWDKRGEKNLFTKRSLSDIDNWGYVINFLGRSHAALKNFSGRFSFATGLIARLQYAVDHGVDISKADKILELANESYQDFERGKYQEHNAITDAWNSATNAVERIGDEGSKTRKFGEGLAYLMRADVAITRVPVNMLYEGVMEYTLGALTGSWLAGKEYFEARSQTKERYGKKLQVNWGPEEKAQFRQELSDQLKDMDADKAAAIVRAYRKGGFGLGVYALALLGHAAFGGFAHKGQTAEDQKKTKRELETGVPEIKTSEIKIGDWTVPETAAKILEHAPQLQSALFGLSLAQVYNNKVVDGESTGKAVSDDALAHINHIINSIPMIDKVAGPLAAGAFQSVQQKYFAGRWDDVDENGNPMKRKAFRASDYLIHLPGISKKGALSEGYYKQAVQTQKAYREQITEVETNTGLSESEKKERRQQLLDEMEQEIDNIYKQNKDNPE